MEKAVILARGLGTRMRKQDDSARLSADQAHIAETGVKALIPIDRPFLDYVLHALAEAGYRKVCLVIGPEHEQVRKYFGETLQPRRISIEFAVQEKPLGTADAVASVESFAGDDYFLVINSDNYYPIEALESLRHINGAALAAFERNSMVAESNIPAERITKFAVIEIDDHGYMSRILEKPDEQTIAALPEPVCVSMNCWRFGPSIFEGCRNIKPSPRGELEITDAVQYTIDKLKEKYTAVIVHSPVLDMSSRTDVAAVTEKLAGSVVNI